MVLKNTVKCKGCGCEVWVGSKIIDGYCHDCYARGRHLPPIVEDPPWSPKAKPVGTPAPARPKPRPPAPPIRRGDWRWLIRNIRRIVLVLLVIAVIGVTMYNTIPALINRWSQTTGEVGTMNMLRDIRYSDFVNRGERIPAETLPENAEAITAAMNSGESYRMNGIFEYAFYDYGDLGHEKRARSNIAMSYDSGNDVYRFVIENSGNDAEGLAHLRIAEGTYYIVSENGATYVLHHGGGRRTATNISDDRVVYDFLMGYVMENLVQTDFITDSNAMARHYMGGDLYAISRDDVGNGLKIYGDSQYRSELRTYQHKPISWYDCDRDKETGIEQQITASYYYEDIPFDNPSVADFNDQAEPSGESDNSGAVPEEPKQLPAASSPAPASALVEGIAVSLDKTVYAAGESMAVTVRGLPQDMSDARAFLAIYDENAAHDAYGQFKYPAAGDSVLEFTAPTGGSYEMRLYRQDYVYTDETFVLSVRFSVEGS